MNKEIFSTFPKADYCVIQNEEFTNIYKLNLIVEYPQPKYDKVTIPNRYIISQPDESYPDTIRQLLEQHNPSYNGEQNYQLIQK